MGIDTSDDGLDFYDESFYGAQGKDSLAAAKLIVPVILDTFKPQSVLELGCGIGFWGSVLIESGIKRYVGVDGPHIPLKSLRIPEENFLPRDLRHYTSVDKYDLAITLETAEHIEPEYAQNFVRTLCTSSDTVVFSAAIPGQGGTNHVNEQWPEYWEELFLAHGFFVQDLLRSKIWDYKLDAWWYKQNLLVFKKGVTPKRSGPLSIVHPGLYQQLLNERQKHTQGKFQEEQQLASSCWNINSRIPAHNGLLRVAKYFLRRLFKRIKAQG